MKLSKCRVGPLHFHRMIRISSGHTRPLGVHFLAVASKPHYGDPWFAIGFLQVRLCLDGVSNSFPSPSHTSCYSQPSCVSAMLCLCIVYPPFFQPLTPESTAPKCPPKPNNQVPDMPYIPSFSFFYKLISLHSHMSYPGPDLYTQRPLCARHLALSARDPARRLPYRNCKRLKRALSAVVVVVTSQAVDVEGDAGRPREALQAVRDHLGAEVPDLLALQSQVNDAIRPVREIHDGAAQGLVQRRVCRPEPC